MSRARAPVAVWREPLPVRRYMRAPVVTVRPETLVVRAAAMLRARTIRHLPVVDRTHHVVGMVSDRDLRQTVFTAAVEDRLKPALAALRGMRVREVMTWNVVTVPPTTDLREAAWLMHDRRIGALPVVADGQLVGILTDQDVLGAVDELLGARVRTVAPLRAATPGETWDYGFADLTPAEPWDDRGAGNA